MKLRNKLILSCAALAAVATTAFSTTFAWYTSNTKVTADNVSGTSANSGSQLLMIADGKKETADDTDPDNIVYTYSNVGGTAAKWGTSIANVTETRKELRPLAYVTDDAAAATSANKYTLMNLVQSLSFTNPTTAVTNQTTFEAAYAEGNLYALASATATTGTKVDGTYAPFAVANETAFTTNKATLYIKNGNTYSLVAADATYDATQAYFKSTYDSTKVYKVGSKTEANPTANFADSSEQYIEFRLLLKNASTTAGKLNINISAYQNSTGSLPEKSIIGENAKYLGLGDSESAYTVDFTRALCLDLEVYKSTDGGATNGTLLSENVHKLASASSVVTIGSDSLTGKTGTASTISTAGATYSAHQYRNAIMDEQVALTDPTTYATGTSTFNSAGTLEGLVSQDNFFTAGTAATKNNCIVLVGKIFLNGWDYACFDACQGQTFQLGLSFDIVSE